jgi:hypothetical protein
MHSPLNVQCQLLNQHLGKNKWNKPSQHSHLVPKHTQGTKLLLCFLGCVTGENHHAAHQSNLDLRSSQFFCLTARVVEGVKLLKKKNPSH